MILPWMILLAPLCSATVITVFTLRWKALSSFISVAAVLASFVCSVLVFRQPDISAIDLTWIDIAGGLSVPLGLTLDQLSKTMLVLVSGVGALIHIYSLGYMRDDDGKSRYFAALSLFMFSMLGIVLANNFVMMFIFWELVGFTSYLLIGHWFERDAAADAAKKAFITNRIGDFGFMLGILMVWMPTGSVVFPEHGRRRCRSLTHQSGLSDDRRAADFLRRGRQIGAISAARLVAGRDGRPDAGLRADPRRDDGRGRRLHARARRLYHSSIGRRRCTVIAWIGTITAVMAALIATQQDDIKRILAYSTLSQLGYMVMAVGLASSDAAMFHLFTHAFFKALLFLGAGSVIIALHHEQDIWEMGGLSRRIEDHVPHVPDRRARADGLLRRLSGFFQQGRDPRARLRKEQADLRVRSRHRVPDRVLHDALARGRFLRTPARSRRASEPRIAARHDRAAGRARIAR